MVIIKVRKELSAFAGLGDIRDGIMTASAPGMTSPDSFESQPTPA
jgi:hypothetical protein